MKNKENNPYATISIKKISAPKKTNDGVTCTKIVGGDLRVKGGK